jgi:hypothetical protein
MTDNRIPVSIDYSSRDFYSIKDDLIARIQSRVGAAGKQWNGTDSSDFGVALVEAFAHVGDVANYYIDRVANENYLATATERQSLLNIAEMYGYVPSGYRRAAVTLTFANYDTEDTAIVPDGTQVYVDVKTTGAAVQVVNRVTFTVLGDVEIPAAADSVTPGVNTGTAVHGISNQSLAANAANPLDPIDFDSELLGQSNGLAEQTFVLNSNHIADGTVEIYVNNGNYYSLWTQVQHLADYGPNDVVYELVVDADNYISVVFGDAVSGAIPSVGTDIKAVYVIGGGEEGNLEGGNTFTISYVPSSANVTVSGLSLVKVSSASNNPATGGTNPESNNNIRKNAPAALRTLRRAVTVEDYANLALSVTDVGKSKAYGSGPTSIALYVSPDVADTSQDYYPGYDVSNTTVKQSWYDLSTSVTNYLADKTQIGTTVTNLPPNYVPVHIEIEYDKYDGYSHDQIKAALKYAVVFGFGYNYTDFDAVIYPEQVEANLILIEGIKTARVVNMYKVGDSVARTPLVAAQGELFVFTDVETDVYPIASLSSLELSSGTLIPGFQPGVTAYRVTDISSSTITVTPTTWDGTSVTVNGATVASGAASTSISTPSATTTTITVVNTSADGIVTATYTISVIR